MSVFKQITEDSDKLVSFIDEIVAQDCSVCPAKEHCANYNLSAVNECDEIISEYLDCEDYSYDTE